MNEIILALLWDLFQHAETIDRSIGGTELAHMPTSCAALEEENAPAPSRAHEGGMQT